MFRKKEGYRAGEKALTKQQADQLLSVIDDLIPKGVIQLALTGALRRDDVISVRQADFDEKTGRLSFFEKKKKRIKAVYLPPNTVSTLTMIKNIYKSEWLFPKKTNLKRHISSKTAYNVLQTYLVRANLDKRPFHALRASCAKIYLASGWSREQVADLLGDRPSTIDAHYTLPSVGEMQELVKNKPVWNQ